MAGVLGISDVVGFGKAAVQLWVFGEWGLVLRTDPGAELKYSPHLCLHMVVGDGLGLGY